MIRKLKSLLPLATAMLFVIAASAPAQQPSAKTEQPKTQKTEKTKPAPSINANDRKFMTETAEGGMAEVELGQSTLSKATNEDVKKFAQRMVDDHSKLNKELMLLAKSYNLSLPVAPGQKYKQTKDRLSKLSAADFDREYMKEMVKDHKKDVAAFELRLRQARDAELKAWVEKTLPTLREHLQMANDIAKKIGVPGLAAQVGK